MRAVVDEQDAEIGYIDKSAAHDSGGVLHRAFSLFVFDDHGRLLAARKLGLPEVPVIRFEHLSEAQKRAYLIADNQLALQAGWSEELLAQELAWLRDESFDLDLVGFDATELERLLAIAEDAILAKGFAATSIEELIVAVGRNPGKDQLFSAEERAATVAADALTLD